MHIEDDRICGRRSRTNVIGRAWNRLNDLGQRGHIFFQRFNEEILRMRENAVAGSGERPHRRSYIDYGRRGEAGGFSLFENTLQRLTEDLSVTPTFRAIPANLETHRPKKLLN